MKALRVTVALLFVVLLQLTPSFANAQVGEPAIAHRYGENSVAGPGRYIELQIRIQNTTDTPILVSGAAITDVLDVTASSPNQCSREWWGDAAYNERPRGEDEQNPPVPNYPLPSIAFGEPIILQPGEDHIFDYLNLYMIEAAGNYCQSRSLRPVYEVNWAFQAPPQTYGTVNGTVTDSSSGEPIIDAAVTISGTTDAGLVSEQLSVDGSGNYTSANSYHTDSELTVTAVSDGYTSASNTATIVEGSNNINISLEKVPVATGTVFGTVVDVDTGEPIPNATVVLNGIDAEGSPVSESVTTTTSGEFSSTIQFQAGSTVSISISANGYVSATSGIEAVAEGSNAVTQSLAAVQEEVPTQTPTPTQTETQTPEVTEPETPTPEATQTETATTEPVPTETPAVEPPLATPVIEDIETPTTPQREQPSTSQPVVSTLPSTGSGGVSSIGLLVGSALGLCAAIAVGIRRRRN